MGVDKKTVLKILGDPEFDPSIFLSDAITEFIANNPAMVAKDSVALNHLIDDPACVHLLAPTIDQLANNDPMSQRDQDMVERFLVSLNKSGNWQRDDIFAGFISKHPNIDIVAAARRNTLEFNSIVRPSRMLSALPGQIKSQLLQIAAEKCLTTWWDEDDWGIAFRTGVPKSAIVSSLESDQFTLFQDKFGIPVLRVISMAARELKGSPFQERLIKECVRRWPNHYVCFACGKGHTNPIKSISGYTLHRKCCDPNDMWPSPWQIFYGTPRELHFDCCRCGQIFSTTSGLTLHQRSCTG